MTPRQWLRWMRGEPNLIDAIDRGEAPHVPNRALVLVFLAFKLLIAAGALYVLVSGVLGRDLFGVLGGLMLGALLALSISRSILMLRESQPRD